MQSVRLYGYSRVICGHSLNDIFGGTIRNETDTNMKSSCKCPVFLTKRESSMKFQNMGGYLVECLVDDVLWVTRLYGPHFRVRWRKLGMIMIARRIES